MINQWSVLAHETVLKIKRPIEEMSSDLRDYPNANVKDNLIKREKELSLILCTISVLIQMP